MSLIEAFQKRPMIAATAIATIVIMGGSVAVELPADRKVEALEVKVAQTWQQREAWQQAQQVYHSEREIDEIDWRMRYISNEINRINQIPEYLHRPVNPQEQWQIDQLQSEWKLLREKRERLSQ